MPNCAILNCKSNSRTQTIAKCGISYHRFPHNPHVKEKWIDATGRTNWMPTKRSTICSKHFDPKLFIMKKSGYRYLSESAVPTLHFVKFYAQNEPKVKEEQSSDSETESSLTTSRNADVVIIKTDPYANTDGIEITRPKFNSKEQELKCMLRGRDEIIKKQLSRIKQLQQKVRSLNKRFAIVDGELKQRKIEDDQMGILREKYVHKEPEKTANASDKREEIEFVRV
ncbi:uncharacterized protein [Epargyreus clarus]|uniref:uncharacterized protein n=1 Tax=Epargyreus clarus TaxID=520877 RepID=UPI003C2DCD7E